MTRRVARAAARVSKVGAWPLRSYFLLLVAMFVLAAGAGALYVHWQVASDSRHEASAIAAGSRLENWSLAIISAGLLAFLLAAWLVYRNLVEPIRRLSGAVRPIRLDATPASSVPVSGPAEVAALAEDLNGLMSSVKLELLGREHAEARARAVSETALDALVTIDHEGKILDFNPAAETMFGYQRAEAVGAQMAELLVPPSLRPGHHRGLQKYLQTGQSSIIGKRIESRAMRADGTEFPTELAISRVPLDGPPIFTGYIRDITQRLKAQDQVRRLAAIVETSRDAIVGRTLEGIVTSWNPAAESLFGYSADEMVGRSVNILATPKDQGALNMMSERLRRGETVELVELERVRKGGRRIQVESSVSPLADESGVIVGASSISRDITERKRAEAAVRLSESRYRELFENATDLIATVDLDDRFVSVNTAFEQALGYPRAELIGRHLEEFVPAEYHAQIKSSHEAKLRGAVDDPTQEHELIARDGRRISVEVSSQVIEEDGMPIGNQAICRDVTARKLLEEQLRQSQRLDSVGRLAGGIAHDFNNLLTVIGGYAEALLEERPPGSEPELQHIADAAERATRLTRQLLAFSRRQVLQPRVLDLNDVVDEITPMLDRLIGADIDLTVRLDPALDHVLADSTQLEQVLVNLVVNARDAMPDGGKLTIETGNVYLDEHYVEQHREAIVGAHAVLAVSDTGTGMDSETTAQVFEPFFTTKPVGSGTGLGLSTVYGIVKQSGGSIWVYSERGKGTTFKVYLPVADASLDAERQTQAHPASPNGTETVLLVEDEEALRDLALRMLGTRGYRVLAAGTGNEALALVAQHGDEIDLLLTDVVMPEMGGRELAARITEQIPGIRVLFMSGYADGAVTRNGALDPSAAFLEKPLTANQLTRKVREVLDQAA